MVPFVSIYFGHRWCFPMLQQDLPNLFFFGRTKNEPLKDISKYMTNIFQSELLNFNLLLELSFYIEKFLT